MLSYERSNMTMLAASAGSDPHGWRNALNYFGWGSIKAGAYEDAAYPSFDAAARAVAAATTAAAPSANRALPTSPLMVGCNGGFAQYVCWEKKYRT